MWETDVSVKCVTDENDDDDTGTVITIIDAFLTSDDCAWIVLVDGVGWIEELVVVLFVVAKGK